ncbi:MAG: xanthine dehydrogenase family protein molybdopterin-binding subunit [Planctomycetota bacterium]|jgi:4-hydroxybenzoyl-CoA reductase subunit alpha
MNKYMHLGKPIRRVDGVEKVTGAAKYTVDIQLPGMLHGKILRSPHPHAKILNIDTAKARALPGVGAVITAADTLKKPYGNWRRYPHLLDEYPLAWDRVRFIGDEIAAVAAVDEETAEEALTLIEVDFEILEAVFDPVEAMKEGAVAIHEGPKVKNNVSEMRHIEFGDVEEGFKKCDLVREDTFTLHAVSHASMEPHATLAASDLAGRLKVWTSTQVPYYIQILLAGALGLEEGKVRIIRPHVGGGWGGKIEMFKDQYCAARLSQITGKPVRIEYTREEEFACTRRRTPMKYHLKTGYNKDGTLVAKEAKAILDGGAYNGMGPTALYLTGFFQLFPYVIPNYRYDGFHVYTNKSPSSSMRGFGGPQAEFTCDSQLDTIAEELGMDPADLRLKNCMEPGYEIPGYCKVASCGITECIERSLESTAWREKRGKLPFGRGIGMGCYGFMSGGVFNWIDTPYSFSAAMIRMGVDGFVDVYVGSAEIGQGSDTVMAQIAAEELGISMDMVRVISGDTAVCPPDLGAWGSRQTLMTGNAVKMAAAEIKAQLIETAAGMMKPNVVYSFDARDGQIILKERPDRGVDILDVVKVAIRARSGLALVGRGFYTPHGKGMVSPAFSFGAQVSEVEVDLETGKVHMVQVTTAHDCGQVINELGVEGQLEGAFVMGQGYTLSENLVTDEGKVLNPSFVDYKLMRAPDVPEKFTSLLVETYEPEGPFGAKEAGEGLTNPNAGCIANAIFDAVGVRIKDMPITPEKILKALEEKKQKAEGKE